MADICGERNEWSRGGGAKMRTFWVMAFVARLPESAKNRLRTAHVRIVRIISGLFCYRRITILRASVILANADPGYSLREYKAYVPSIAATAKHFGREYPSLEERFRKRFEKGMRYYELFLDNQVLGTAWIHPDGFRFIDEIGFLLPISKNSIWIRDAFVAPEFRGRGLFSRMINMIISEYFPHISTIMSDTEICNKASMAAHQGCGFKLAGTMRVLHVAKMLMLRDLPSPTLNAGGYKLPSMVCITGNRYRDYCNEHIA